MEEMEQWRAGCCDGRRWSETEEWWDEPDGGNGGLDGMKMAEEMEEWPTAVSPSRRVRMERGGHRRKRLAWMHQRSFTLGVREDWYDQVGSILRDEGVAGRIF